MLRRVEGPHENFNMMRFHAAGRVLRVNFTGYNSRFDEVNNTYLPTYLPPYLRRIIFTISLP